MPQPEAPVPDDRPAAAGDGTLPASGADRVARTRRFPDLLRTKHRELGTASERDLDVIELVTDLTRLVSRLVQDFENAVHRPLDLTWAGFRIINSVWVFDGLEQQDIGRLSGSSRASVSAALNTLENRGLVTRRRATVDRRNVDVALTPEGLDSLRTVIAAQTERERAWTAVLSDQEIRTLITLLRRLVDQETPPKPAPPERD